MEHLPHSCGADGRNRTGDLFLTKEVLYLLSYISQWERTQDALRHLQYAPVDLIGIEPTTPWLQTRRSPR